MLKLKKHVNHVMVPPTSYVEYISTDVSQSKFLCYDIYKCNLLHRHSSTYFMSPSTKTAVFISLTNAVLLTEYIFVKYVA